MILWEYCENHICNDYKISQFYNIRSGIILNGTVAYICMPIENTDKKSHIKILFQNKKLKNCIPHTKSTTILLKCVRNQSLKSLIPCMKQIQVDLNGMLGINDDLYKGDETTYLTLLHRIYLLTFMLRYKMFRDRSMNSVEFQQKIQYYRFIGYFSDTSFQQTLRKLMQGHIVFS